MADAHLPIYITIKVYNNQQCVTLHKNKHVLNIILSCTIFMQELLPSRIFTIKAYTCVLVLWMTETVPGTVISMNSTLFLVQVAFIGKSACHFKFPKLQVQFNITQHCKPRAVKL